ncbi:TPA: hypothetical protein L8S39_004520 [Klebsiella pneumoniae]|nr:hypothetical protein [Klebsiella pneumoniae]HBQ7866132.1 hypothetical protein [Klebsiella pneumoniae]HBQ7877507.1 hypothetical protein [Klebsiella pneumoniae]HBQ7883457.1 hypothetical protein [Klebsiella pneumoniae]HBQ7894218.1 hypothetical protein [Klebsiella pneumoniae]
MTITLQAVNELIASLESAGELSIREQKFLKLAKAFKQLAAENVALKSKGKEFLGEACAVYSRLNKLIDPSIGDFVDGQTLHEFQFVLDAETPATDAFLAWIKAEAKSHDLNAFISHYSAELDNHIANGGDQFDERAVRLRGVIVGARMFREKLRDEEKALALREEAGK